LEINQGYTTMHGQPIIKISINLLSCPHFTFPCIIQQVLYSWWNILQSLRPHYGPGG